ncbi:MAG: type II toxin-antitoxin system HicB family antitoxin [Actinophytocola sp.]|nr:type II toxin-antitoxin system HicB family antitoxin [Actinophytocola sp.]
MTTTYAVHVTREAGQWLADIPEVPGAHTHARSLHALHRAVREVITLMADYPDSAVDDEDAFAVEFRFVDEVGTTVEPVRRLREQIASLQEELARRTHEVLHVLDEEGLSLRDEAEVLGLSHQRVQQLRHAEHRELQDA